MGRIKEDILGVCSICGCSIFYKSESKESRCEHEPPKWEVLEDGSVKLDIRIQRKEKFLPNKINMTNRKNYL